MTENTEELIHHSILGRITPEQMRAHLDAAREAQEAAWRAAGWTPEQIARQFKGWPSPVPLHQP